jgi:hypothetical protein
MSKQTIEYYLTPKKINIGMSEAYPLPPGSQYVSQGLQNHYQVNATISNIRVDSRQTTVAIVPIPISLRHKTTLKNEDEPPDGSHEYLFPDSFGGQKYAGRPAKYVPPFTGYRIQPENNGDLLRGWHYKASENR